MQPLRFGIDFDGVIADHRAHKLRLAGELGVALEPWQVNSNLMRDFVPEEAYQRLQERVYGELTPLAAAVRDALGTLALLPGETYVVSARRPGNEAPARTWMERNGLYTIVPPERVIFCESGAAKRAHAERLGLSMFLDDRLSYLGHLPEATARVLFDEDGVAERLEIPPDVRVARGWAEFLAYAKEAAIVREANRPS